MKTIYLVRHGKAVSRELDIPDYERSLVDKGEKNSVKMAYQSTTAGWGPKPSVTSGASDFFDGQANQAWIVANKSPLSAYEAFSLCENLTRHSHTDWYLPSRAELDLLYMNKSSISSLTENFTWSSTNDSTTNAWFEQIDSGTPVPGAKDTPIAVRCMRRD